MPDERGYFGDFGGRWVAETLVPALQQLEQAFASARADPAFQAELAAYNQHYGGRATPLYRAQRLSDDVGGATIWLKREDLVHGGAHKFNNVMGQALLARRMGKSRIIAETGAGQHGVATAMAGAVLGLPVEVYMGEKDVARQELNVFRMRLFGAEVHGVPSGNGTLKDAVNEALRAWAARPDDTYYCVGSVVGPHPYPWMVREFQRVIGDEIRQQFAARAGGLPDALVACVGGGSNAIGTFHPFVDERSVRMVGVEAGGMGVDTRQHAATLSKGRPGILHGALSYLLQDEDGQVQEPHSISAGLDYPGVGPEHSHLHATQRVEYVAATDAQALGASQRLCRLEGILPALESAHAVAVAEDVARELGPGRHVVVTLSGRGDKDVHTLRAALGQDPPEVPDRARHGTAAPGIASRGTATQAARESKGQAQAARGSKGQAQAARGTAGQTQAAGESKGEAQAAHGTAAPRSGGRPAAPRKTPRRDPAARTEADT